MPNITQLAADILSIIEAATNPDTGHIYIDLSAPTLEISGDLAVVNSQNQGFEVLAVSDANLDQPLSEAINAILGTDSDTITDIVNAIEAITFTGDVSIVNSTTGGKTKIKTTPDNPSNLDAAISSVITAIQSLGTVTANFTDVPVINPIVNNQPIPLVVQTELAGIVAGGALLTADVNLTACQNQKVNYIAVREAPATAGIAGQMTVPITTAQELPSQACSEVTIQASANNTQPILFGFYANECVMELAAGRDFTIAIGNVNLLWAVSSGNATQTLNYICRL